MVTGGRLGPSYYSGDGTSECVARVAAYEGRLRSSPCQLVSGGEDASSATLAQSALG